MEKKYVAIRNLAMCTKDCLCLYVCPTYATDTEDSIIDKDKCIGCGICANACPSKAISMMPLELPPQKEKDDIVLKKMNKCLNNKADEINLIKDLINKDSNNPLFKAIKQSLIYQGEDIAREAGYMLPDSNNAIKLLENLKNNNYLDLDISIINELLELLNK